MPPIGIIILFFVAPTANVHITAKDSVTLQKAYAELRKYVTQNFVVKEKEIDDLHFMSFEHYLTLQTRCDPNLAQINIGKCSWVIATERILKEDTSI